MEGGSIRGKTVFFYDIVQCVVVARWELTCAISNWMKKLPLSTMWLLIISNDINSPISQLEKKKRVLLTDARICYFSNFFLVF